MIAIHVVCASKIHSSSTNRGWGWGGGVDLVIGKVNVDKRGAAGQITAERSAAHVADAVVGKHKARQRALLRSTKEGKGARACLAVAFGGLSLHFCGHSGMLNQQCFV